MASKKVTSALYRVLVTSDTRFELENANFRVRDRQLWIDMGRSDDIWLKRLPQLFGEHDPDEQVTILVSEDDIKAAKQWQELR